MSITLTSSYTVSINGQSVESDAVGGATSVQTDFLGNTITFQLVVGSLLNGNINAGPIAGTQAQNVYVTINLTTGAWTSTNNKSGIVDPTVLSTLITQIRNNRNAMESFAITATIMPGTQVPWT